MAPHLSIHAQELKTGLLQCIEAEPERIIRKKVCDAVGQLGITLLNEDQGAWPELLPFMLGATRSGNVNMHESALVIFNALSDFIAGRGSCRPRLAPSTPTPPRHPPPPQTHSCAIDPALLLLSWATHFERSACPSTPSILPASLPLLNPTTFAPPDLPGRYLPVDADLLYLPYLPCLLYLLYLLYLGRYLPVDDGSAC